MFGRTAVVIGVLSMSGLGLFGSAAVAALVPATPSSTDEVPAVAQSAARGPKNGGAERVKTVLDGLVAKGVISQAQEDAILAALASERKDADQDSFIRRVLGGLIEESATYLGISPADLKAKLPGTSLAAIAEATPGKSRAGLVADLSRWANAAIDKALADKKITQERADTARAAVPDRVAKLVDQRHASAKRGPKPVVPKPSPTTR